jgi:intracellular septation protein A
MHYFVSLIEEYVLYEVIHNQWLQFKKGLTSLTLFEELVDLHNTYLDTVLEKCFLRGTIKDGRAQTDIAQEKKL